MKNKTLKIFKQFLKQKVEELWKPLLVIFGSLILLTAIYEIPHHYGISPFPVYIPHILLKPLAGIFNIIIGFVTIIANLMSLLPIALIICGLYCFINFIKNKSWIDMFDEDWFLILSGIIMLSTPFVALLLDLGCTTNRSDILFIVSDWWVVYSVMNFIILIIMGFIVCGLSYGIAALIEFIKDNWYKAVRIVEQKEKENEKL